MSTVNDIDKLIQALENPPMKEMKELAEKIGKELEAQCKKDVTRLIKRSIDEFYHTYNPKYYKRKYSLKYMFRVSGGNNGSLTIKYGGEFARECHRASNDDIFELVFMEGFHGGIKEGKYHPNPGTPYWRTPYPDFTEWGLPAANDESPMERAEEKLKDYENGELLELQNEKIRQEYINWLGQLL